MSKKYDLRQLRKNKADLGVDVIEFDAPNGDTFRIPAPGFFPDAAHNALRDKDAVTLAESLLGGPEEYQVYREAGGKADDIGLLLEAWSDDQGTTLPKS